MAIPSRRAFVKLLPLMGLAGALGRLAPGASSGPPASGAPSSTEELGEGWPAHPPELAREMVGVSHGNLARVRELVEARPSLARASWDWGFGDWESAIDAASHVGNREIAQVLIDHGARPTLFTAAMLGRLEVVRATVAASPGIQRTRGPHGITLLAHARAGGEAAAAVVAFLESLGDADPALVDVPLAEAEIARLVGVYAFGDGTAESIEIDVEKGRLGFRRSGGSRRALFHLGSQAFHPAGAEAVRIRFTLAPDRATTLTVEDPDAVLVATRDEP